MPVDLEKLIFAQHLVFDWITKVIFNDKRLSKENINYDITKRRLDTLNAQ